MKSPNNGEIKLVGRLSSGNPRIDTIPEMKSATSRENLSSVFANRKDSNPLAKLQKLARRDMYIRAIHIKLSGTQTTLGILFLACA